MKVALWSARPVLGGVAKNIDMVVKAIRSKEAELVVFPEMFLTGYAIGDDAQRLAFASADPRLQPLVSACKSSKTHLVVGAPRRDRAGMTFNSALLVDDEGNVSWYDKRVLPTFTTFQEGLFFSAGTESPVWKTRLGTFGLSICYDLFFPEHQRLQVLRGADVLVNISASPSPSRPFFELLVQARAVENAVFSLYSNNVGAQDNLVFWGGARAIGPRGQTLAAAKEYEETRILVDLVMEDLEAAREFRPTLRDAKETDSLALAPARLGQPRHANSTPKTPKRPKSKSRRRTPGRPAGPAKPKRR